LPERSNIKVLSNYAVIALIGLMGAIRFWGLDWSPPGFFMDEAYIGAHVLCLAHTGHDADGRPWPLFSPSGGGGFASPTHLYPAAAWVRCFGGSIVSLRAYAAFTMTIAIVGLYFLARRLMGPRGAIYTTLAASLSPFLFQFSRMAFDDPAAFLLGLTWGAFFFLRSGPGGREAEGESFSRPRYSGGSERNQRLPASGPGRGRAATGRRGSIENTPSLALPRTTGRGNEGTTLGVSRISSWRDAILSAAFLSLAAYAYPSGRIVLPFVFGLLVWMKCRQRELRWSSIAVFAATGIVLCLPLAIQTLQGGLMARYEAVGLFTAQYRHEHGLEGPRVWLAFLKNYLLHLAPNFLFLHGDPNLRHNSQFSGELSWLDTAALVLGVIFLATRWRKGGAKVDRVIVFAAVGFFVGILPAAITWEGLPHALRCAACWPFVALLTGRILARLEEEWRWSPPLFAGIAAVFAVGFLYHYFAIYPTKAEPYYQSLVKDAAEYGQASGDWDKFRTAARAEAYDPHACRYFLMEYAGMDCRQAAEFKLK
jgi:hypothetical protein